MDVKYLERKKVKCLSLGTESLEHYKVSFYHSTKHSYGQSHEDKEKNLDSQENQIMNLKAVETRKIVRIRTFPDRKQKRQKEDSKETI